MFKTVGTGYAIILVFLASACTMVIEMVAGRILAPIIGVSLYTWTSNIGIILAGIGLGNFLGGKAADRFNSPLFLSIIFFAGSLLSLAIIPITDWLGSDSLPITFHVMSRATIYTFVLFFLPAVVLGMVTPVVIKLTLRNLGQTANVVGTIYAISCFGSILGTFLTGYFLISTFGTMIVVWQVAVTLLLMALFCSGFWRSKIVSSLIAVALVAFLVIFQYRGHFQPTYFRESNYYAINITDAIVDGRSVKALILDKFLHSYVDLNDSLFLADTIQRLLPA
jgi:MFS family permease